MSHSSEVTMPTWRPALLGVPTGGDSIRCDLCPHACELSPGATGVCGVRRNRGGVLQTATFAIAVSHLDAMERKPFYHVRPGSKVLTIAGPGCSFRCNYCINHRLSQFGRLATVPWAGGPARVADLVERAGALGAGIAMSYSEPGLAPELALAIAEHSRPSGIPLVWKTNGFLTARAIDLVAGALDAVNIDVKAAEDGPHRRLTGAPLLPVLDSIERFRAAGVWVEVSTPLIPGTASSDDQLRALARVLGSIDPGLPWHLLRFTPDFRMRRFAPTTPAALARAVAIAGEAGLRFVYVERALGKAGRTTRCPSCGCSLVERDIWVTTACRLEGGACPSCATPIPGRWS
jgi:pyruvate formate lyase activating enzyme